MPLHFNRTGVRVVAMCPGPTDTPTGKNGTGFYDEEWKTFLDGLKYQS